MGSNYPLEKRNKKKVAKIKAPDDKTRPNEEHPKNDEEKLQN